VTRGSNSFLSVDTGRLIDVWVVDAILADVVEIMEDERMGNLESLIWFPLLSGNGIGVSRTARKKRFIANDMATICPTRRNAYKRRMFRRFPIAYW